MKRGVLLSMMVLLSAGAVWAQTYHSDFGFVVTLPSGWETIRKEEMIQDPGVLDAALGAARERALKDVDRDMLGQLKAMVLAGNVEYYFHRENLSLISVLRKSGAFVQTPPEVSKACAALPGQLTKLMGRPTKVYECELRRMENFNALYTVADGFKEEAKLLQYQIQKSPDEVLIISATCHNQHCKEASRDFDQMVSSLRLK